MTRGQQVLAELVLAEVKAGRLKIQGNRFIRDGVAVQPVLAFERDEAPAKSNPAAGAQRSAGQQHEHSDMVYPAFAPLPASRLVSSNQASGDRAGMAEQRRSATEPIPQRREAAQTIEWPKNLAPLPPNALTRKDR